MKLKLRTFGAFKNFGTLSLKVLLSVALVLVVSGVWGQTTTRYNDGYLSVFRVTSGSALASTGTAIVIDEYHPSTAAQTSPNFNVALPSVSSGLGANDIVVSGSATAAGQISRSENGRFILIPGYNALIGAANSTFNTNSVVRTLNGSGTMSSGISGANYSSGNNNLRGATSDDGSNFWMTGNGLGVIHTTSSSPTTLTTVSSTTTNNRASFIFNGQLYFTTGAGTQGIYSVGTGKPITTGQTSTRLFAPTNTDVYGFSISPDGNTVYYVAASSGGIYRSVFTTSWSAGTLITTGFTGGTGIAVDWTNYTFSASSANGAIIYASNPTTVVRGADNGTSTITLTTLRTISGNNAFRGLAFSPIQQTIAIGSSTPATGNINGGDNNVVLGQFRLEAAEGNSTVKRIIVNNSGTATVSVSGSTDILAPRLFVDLNGNGIVDGSDSLISTGTVSGSNITFSNIVIHYIEQGSSRNYLVVGDIASSATNGSTFVPNIASTNTINSITYTSNIVNASGSLVTMGTGANAPVGNTLTVASAIPSITLNNNTQISPANVNQGTNDHLLSRFRVEVATANATLNQITFTAGGTFIAGDITNFKLYTNTTNTFPGGTPLATVSASAIANGGTVTFNSLSQTCAIGDRYFWIAADVSATATATNTVIVPSLGASNFTFAAGTPSGTIDAGGAQTFVAVTPNIVLSSPSASSADITQGINNQQIYRFDLAVTVANATLNGLTINTSGTYVAADLTNLKAWYSADATFDVGSDVLLSTKTTGLGAGSQVFPSFSSQVINTGSTGYIFITADLPFTATAGNTIAVDAITTTDISFVSGNKSGTANASGTKTIIACTPTNATALNLTSGNGQLTVSWTNPACFDELMIVAKPSSTIGASPSGDGSAYTANLAFGTGGASAFDGTGFVVYKGSTSPQTITGLTNGTSYFVRVFTRRGSVWSAGVESSATPNLVNSTKITWINTGTASAWYTSGNWSPARTSAQWAASEVAAFENSGTATTAGINMGTASLSIAAIEVSAARTRSLSVGNSSTTSGTLTLNGGIVNSTENVILRNASDSILSLVPNVSNNSTMEVILTNTADNKIVTDGNGGITISTFFSGAAPIRKTGSGSGVLILSGANSYTGLTTVEAGTLRLNRTGGTTIPNTNNVTVNGGTLRVSTNQELNDLTVGASGALTIDASTTLTINDDLVLSGTLNNSGTLRLNKAAGNTVPNNTNFNITSGTLRISSNQTLNDLTVASGATLTIDAGVVLTINGNLSLGGTLDNAGTIDMGNRTVALSGTVTGSGVIRTNGGTLNITGSGALGTLNFDQTTDGTTNSLAALSINRSTSGSVTLGNKLNVTETVTLTDGVLASGGHLHLKSTSAASTARINGGTNASITGNVNFERFLPWAGAGNNGFRFATHSLRTAPVINTISGLPVATNTLILFNETNNSYEGISNRAGTWPLAAGYGVWTNAANTLTYSGEPQLNSVGPISLPRANAGWHYLGNPFPSVLDWEAVTRTQVDNAIYIWEKDNTGEGNGVWGSYVNGTTANNGSQYVAPGQGFAVRSQVGSPEITFPAAARSTAANPAYYRLSNQADVLRVRVTKASNQFSLETVIRFRDLASSNFDPTYDALFVSDFSNNSPDLYTTDGQGNKYSINSLAPLGTQPVLVPLQLETFGAGNYSFTFNSSAMISGASIQLEDTKTGSFTPVANGDVINFIAGANDATGRFRLHFNGLATSVAANSLDQVQVYTFEGKLYIRGMEQAEQLRIVDMTGRVVYQHAAVQLSAEGLQPQLAAGTYLVQLVGKQGVKTAKVQF